MPARPGRHQHADRAIHLAGHAGEVATLASSLSSHASQHAFHSRSPPQWASSQLHRLDGFPTSPAALSLSPTLRAAARWTRVRLAAGRSSSSPPSAPARPPSSPTSRAGRSCRSSPCPDGPGPSLAARFTPAVGRGAGRSAKAGSRHSRRQASAADLPGPLECAPSSPARVSWVVISSERGGGEARQSGSMKSVGPLLRSGTGDWLGGERERE